jgi:hypothetical protein
MEVLREIIKMKLFVLLVVLFLPNISFAKVTLEKLDEFDKFHRQYALLYLSESIEVEDTKAFQEAIDKVNTEGLHVKHDSVIINNSPGGNVETAKKISRIIRKNKLSTWVPKDKYCSSACLYVFIGGICRMGQGKIGVHRGFSPYSYQRIRSLEEVKDTTDSSFNDDVKFFDEMNTRSSLVSILNQVPYWTMKVLSHDEKLQYGFYSTIEEYELERLEEVAMNTGKSKDDLMTSLVDRYYEINRNDLWKRLISKWTWITFKKNDNPKYLKCSEQLFLTDAY